MSELILPLPPSANSYQKWTGRKWVWTVRALTFKRDCSRLVPQVIPKPLLGRIGVEIEYYAKDKRSRDLDNLLKCLCDSLQGLAYENDSQVDEIRIVRREIEPPGKLVVQIEELKIL